MSFPAAEPTASTEPRWSAEPSERSGVTYGRRAGDRLTGLVDRDAFARAVDQADRDRDRMMVAVVTVDGLAEVNQLCGYDAGDSLLASLGRALAERASVDLTAGRVGGGHLALLVTPLGQREPGALIDPILADLGRAIERWVDDRAALGTPSPIVPHPRIGLAAGYGGATWADAEVALAVAKGDPDGPPSVSFDLTDPRLAGRRRRQRLAEELVDALHHQRLTVELTTVAPLDHDPSDRPEETWQRLSSRPALRSRPSPEVGQNRAELGADDLAMAPGLAARLDGHLLARAADLVDRPGGPGATVSSAGNRRVAVPVLGPLRGPTSSLAALAGGRPEEAGAPTPPGIILEVDQRRLLDLADAADRAAPLASQLDRLGWELAITDFDGGWAAWSLIDHYPVHHVRPRSDLVQAAMAGDPIAGRLLTADVDGWQGSGPRLVVSGAVGAGAGATAERLGRLGLTHIERPTD